MFLPGVGKDTHIGRLQRFTVYGRLQRSTVYGKKESKDQYDTLRQKTGGEAAMSAFSAG